MPTSATPPASSGVQGRVRLYWPQLDGLRFLAALVVFIRHAPSPPGMPQILRETGWAGVDLFLVLSAFLLSRLLREEISSTGEVRLSKYFARRVLRIWPLYWGYVTAILVAVLVRGTLTAPQIGNWLSHLAFINNWTVTKVGYEGNLPLTAHLWTISLEEQFYLIIPLAMPVLMKQSRRMLVTLLEAMLVLLVIARVACLLLGTEGEIKFLWALPLRGDAFVLGTALALGLFDRIGRLLPGDLLFAIGVAMFAAIPLVGTPETPTLWGTSLLFTFTDAACLLMVMGCLEGKAVAATLGWAPLRYLGRISFGLYVYHQVAIRLAKAMAGRFGIESDGWAHFGLALAITIGASVISYELYEKWFLKLKSRFEIIVSRPA